MTRIEPTCLDEVGRRIAEDRDLGAKALHDGQRLCRIPGGGDLVPDGMQHLRQHDGRVLVVVHDQDPERALRLTEWETRRSRGRFLFACGADQREQHRMCASEPTDPLRALCFSNLQHALRQLILMGRPLGEDGAFASSLLGSPAYREALEEASRRLEQLWRRAGC